MTWACPTDSHLSIETCTNYSTGWSVPAPSTFAAPQPAAGSISIVAITQPGPEPIVGSMSGGRAQATTTSDEELANLLYDNGCVFIREKAFLYTPLGAAAGEGGDVIHAVLSRILLRYDLRLCHFSDHQAQRTLSHWGWF